MNPLTQEIAATAARIVVEEGLEYGPAKRRAVKQLGLPPRAELPGNDELEEAVFEYLSVFCADTQPTELRALRELAAVWMQRLAEFRPHLSGAVWRGTATRLSDIHLQLYCDDSKSAEIQLLSKGVDYDVSSAPGPRGTPVDRLSLTVNCEALGEPIGLHLTILDADDLRGALKPDARGRSERGDLAATEAAAGASPTSPRSTSSANDPNVAAGDPLPAGFWDVHFDTPEGTPFNWAGLQGKPLLLNFWATWCPPCVKEMPELDRFRREFSAAGWQVVGLAIDGPTPVKEFLTKVKVGFGVALAGFGGTELAQTLGNTAGGLPFTVLIDAQGRIRHRKMGATHFDELAAWARAMGPA